jgi:hypothetical protein
VGDCVTAIEACAFNGCNKLHTLQLGNSLVELGDGAFVGCSSLTKIKLPDTLLYINKGAFSGCDNLEIISLGNSLRQIGEEAFTKTKITDLYIPSSVTTIETNAFNGCESLKTVTFGESLAAIGPGAFEGCSQLKTIISAAKKPPVIESDSFKDCELIAKIYCGTYALTAYKEAPNWKTFAEEDKFIADDLAIKFALGAAAHKKYFVLKNSLVDLDNRITYLELLTNISINTATLSDEDLDLIFS